MGDANDPDPVATVPDLRSRPDRFTEGVERIRERFSGEIGDDVVRSLFERDFDRLAETKTAAIRSAAAKLGIQTEVARLDQAQNDYVRLAATTRNPLERARYLARAAASGIINPIDAAPTPCEFRRVCICDSCIQPD